jgi:hypothetical protein
MVAHAVGRWPQPERAGDSFLLVAACAFVSLATPTFGLIASHRQYLAVYVYPLAAMLWLIAWYRFGGTARAPMVAAIAAALLGLVAGASTRPIGTIGAIVVAALVHRRFRAGERVPAWMWTGLAGVSLGVVLVWIDTPHASFARLWFNRIDANLAALHGHVGQNGRIVGVLALLLLVLLARQTFGGRPVAVPRLDQLLVIRQLVVIWAALALVGLVGPISITPVKLAPAVALCIAGLIVLNGLMESAGVGARRELGSRQPARGRGALDLRAARHRAHRAVPRPRAVHGLDVRGARQVAHARPHRVAVRLLPGAARAASRLGNG